MKQVVVAADLGGTNIRAAIVDEDGQVFARRERKTPDRADEVVGALSELLGQVAGASAQKPLAAGIGSPGMIDADAGVVVLAKNLAGFRNIQLAAPITDALGMPAFIENDASAAALGEHRFGAGRGNRHLLHLTLGTGIGGGIVIDNRLYRGARGFAGEVGHVVLDPAGPRCTCGSRGCVEAMVSGWAFADRAKKLIQSGASPVLLEIVGYRDATAADLYAAATAGDRQCEAEIRNGGHLLGIAIGGLVNVLNPGVVTLSGGLLQMGDMLLRPAREALASIAYGSAAGTQIVTTALDDDAGLLGAAAVAFERAGTPG